MDFSLKTGLRREATALVDETNTAVAMGSGSLPVYATPALAALLEKAAAELVEAELSGEWTSVGTLLHIEHIAATPPGLLVRAEAELIASEGRKLSFKVTAFDGVEMIGRGTHERFLVKKTAFMQKAARKIAENSGQ